MRVLSRKTFKKGGKVMGDCNAPRADRKPRKSGGKAITADSLINRDAKEANELREGKKHIGGMKKGGAATRKGREEGGKVDEIAEFLKNDSAAAPAPKNVPLPPPRPKDLGRTAPAKPPAKAPKDIVISSPYNKGGRTKKMMGGPMMGGNMGGMGGNMMGGQFDPNNPAKVQDKAFSFQGNPVTPGLKRGGKAVKHDDVAADKALIKKMVKSEARTGKADGGEMAVGTGSGKRTDKPQNVYQPDYDEGSADKAIKGSRQKIGGRESAAIKALLKGRTGKARGGANDSTYGVQTPLRLKKTYTDGDKIAKVYKDLDWGEHRVKFYKDGKYLSKADYHTDDADDAHFSAQEMLKKLNTGGRTGRKTGGGVFTGPGYPGKVPGVVPGGRDAHARGGKTGKGKTNINIVIAAGKTPGADAGLMPPGAMPKPPGGMPIPMPAGGPPAGGAPMPMPVPMPMPAPAGGAPGMPPMGRKAGGRISKVAKSYKDMTAGAGSGEGRLQKTDIAKARDARKAGGGVYRSYKDMDAGAASGLGRLEKTEIAKHKR
jgi:hypothetical protein